MNPSMTLVRMNEPAFEEPADTLSVMPVVSVFDALHAGGLGHAILHATNLPAAEEIKAASLDELMALVVEGLSEHSVCHLSNGDHGIPCKACQESTTDEQRTAVYWASRRLYEARPADTGLYAKKQGRQPVIGMRLVEDTTEDRPRLRAVPTLGEASA